MTNTALSILFLLKMKTFKQIINSMSSQAEMSRKYLHFNLFLYFITMHNFYLKKFGIMTYKNLVQHIFSKSSPSI